MLANNDGRLKKLHKMVIEHANHLLEYKEQYERITGIFVPGINHLPIWM
jgi:hypothetical protein